MIEEVLDRDGGGGTLSLHFVLNLECRKVQEAGCLGEVLNVLRGGGSKTSELAVTAKGMTGEGRPKGPFDDMLPRSV